MESFTLEGIFPLLESYGISKDDLDIGLKWVAVFVTATQSGCLTPFSFADSYILSWVLLLLLLLILLLLHINIIIITY